MKKKRSRIAANAFAFFWQRTDGRGPLPSATLMGARRRGDLIHRPVVNLIRAEGIYVRARVAQLRSSRREERVGGLRTSEKSERFGCGAVGD